MEDWKNFEVQPDEGFFAQIQHRLHVRRAWRIAGVAGASLLVATAAATLLLQPKSVKAPAVATPQPVAVAVAPQPAPAAAVQPAAAASPDRVSAPKPSQTAAAMANPDMTAAAQPTPVQQGSPASSLLPTPAPAQPAASPAVDEPLAAPAPQAAEPSAEVVPAAALASTDMPAVADEPSDAESAAKAGAPVSGTSTEPGLLWAPNAIAPEGEKEENRLFKVHLNSKVTDFKLFIYNRGGRRVFSSSDPTEAWDATYHGRPAAQGAYVWVATFRDAKGNSHSEAGSVAVIR